MTKETRKREHRRNFGPSPLQGAAYHRWLHETMLRLIRERLQQAGDVTVVLSPTRPGGAAP